MREADHDCAREPPVDEGISYRGVMVGAGIVVGTIVVALVSAYALLHVVSGSRSSITAVLPGSARGPSTGPALQPDPAHDVDAYRAEKEKQLTTYGWVDRAHGVVHIPITRAMELVAQQASHPGVQP